jgi:hypothetical protein
MPRASQIKNNLPNAAIITFLGKIAEMIGISKRTPSDQRNTCHIEGKRAIRIDDR